MKEYDHLTGRLDGMFVDIDPANSSADRLMQPAGFTKIANKAKDVRKKWYGSVNELV